MYKNQVENVIYTIAIVCVDFGCSFILVRTDKRNKHWIICGRCISTFRHGVHSNGEKIWICGLR